MPRRSPGTAAVRRIATSGGSVTVLHGTAREWEGGTDAGAFSLKLVRRGRATWVSQGRRVTLSETMFTFLPAGAPYRICIASDAPVETACVFFPDALFADIAASVLPSARLLDRTPPPPPDWWLSANAADARVVTPLVRVIVADGPPDDDAADHVVLTVVPALFALQARCGDIERIDAVRATTREELRRRVAVGRAWLLDHLGTDVSLRAAARAAAMSPFHFHRTFSAVVGVAPMRYVTERRLERAAFLLTHTRRPITDICLESGFVSPGSFATAFKKRFGLAPREYRATSN